MAEEIIIGKLIIDTSDLESSMAQSKRAIIDLENEQKKLKKDTEGLTSANEEQLKTFIDNETQLKKIKAEYSANQKSVLDLTRAQLGLDEALLQQNRTQAEAAENTKELINARRQLDATTLDGAKAIAEINAKIDQNNNFLNANNSNLEQQKVNIGNYGSALKDAANNLNPLNGGLEGFIERSREAGGAGKLVQSSLAGMASGFIGVAKASLAFILTPVGAFIAALVIVFGAIRAAMSRSEDATAKITKVFAVFSGIVNLLLKAISVLGEYWINSYVKILDAVGAATEKVMKGISSGLSLLGFSKAAKSVDEFTASTKGSIKASQDLAASELQLEKSQRKARLTQLEYQKVAEKFRQIRDDETKTIAERIKANDDLGLTLKKQLKDELAIAQLALKVANLRLAQEGQTGAALDKQADALTQIADIQERITGQESEQIVNRVSLQKEAADKQKEYADAQRERASKAFQADLKESQNRIDILKTEGNARNLDASERLALAQKVFDAENALAKKSSGGSDLQKQLLTNRQNLSSAILEITDAQISKEADAQKAAIEQTKAVNAELYDSQSQSANDLATAQLFLLNKKVLSEKDYANEVIKINQIKNESLTAIQTNFDTAETLKRETETANAKILDDLQFQIRLQDITDRDATEQEIKRALLQENYSQELSLLDENLAAKKLSEEAYRAAISLADKKYAAATKSIDKQLNAQKRAETERTVANGLAAAGELFEGSKAVAVASALFNTYQGITAELSTKAVTPYEIGLKVANVAFVAAAGFAAVKNILKTDKGSSSGDAGSARPQTTSGAGSFVNTAQTETVARVSDTPQQQNTIVTPPVIILEQLNEAQNNLAIKLGSG